MRDAPKDIHRTTKAQQKDDCLFLAYVDCGDSIFCHKHEAVPEQHPQSANLRKHLFYIGSNRAVWRGGSIREMEAAVAYVQEQNGN